MRRALGAATAALRAPAAGRRAIHASTQQRAAAPNTAAPASSQTQRDDCQYILRTYARQPLELVRGEGVWLWDASGRKFMDFHSGIAVNSLGHSHPAWVAAVQSQAAVLTHTSNLFFSAPQTALAKQLIEMSEGSFDKVFFCNSGTEATEAALKFTRKYQLVRAREKAAADIKQFEAAEKQAERPHNKLDLIAFKGGFHGRSIGALSLTSKWPYRGPFAPLLDNVQFLPFNDCAAVEAAVGPQTAGLFVEPIQGEGGVHPARADFLAACRETTRRHDALLVLDEVQAGLSRTGSVIAHKHAFVSGGGKFGKLDADIMTMAKPLAGGLPIGAVLVKQKVADCMQPGDHGSTFSGGPLVCSAAGVVVRELTRPALLSNVAARSTQLMDGLRQIQKRLEDKKRAMRITDVRGVGLLVGCELNGPIAGIVAAATDRGLMLISAGENVLRLCPPLVISEQEMDFALQTLEDAILAADSAQANKP